MKSGQIIAMGSGRNIIYDDQHPFHEYVLSLVDKTRVSIGFLPTATGDSKEYIVSFYELYGKYGCQTSHLPLFNRLEKDLRSWFNDQDMIYVGGGNTANMLAVWRLHGVDVILKEFLSQGKIVFGGSAGGLCWFEGGITDSFALPNQPVFLDGLGFLPGSFCPHFDSDPIREPLYKEALKKGSLPPGYALDDFAALHFVSGKLEKSFSLQAGAQAYFFDNKSKPTTLKTENIY